MTADSIFRIYSMTKPVTSVVALMLVEEGKLDLAAPLSRYLPEFAEMTVATGTGSDGKPVTEPAARPITILDPMRHTAGLTWGGSAGTYMRGDPAEGIFVIWMLQAPKKSGALRAVMRNMIYGSIEELRTQD